MHRARVGPSFDKAFVASGDDQIAADQRVGFARGDAGRMERVRIAGHAHVRGHGAVFLAEPGEVEIGAVEPVEIGRDRRVWLTVTIPDPPIPATSTL